MMGDFNEILCPEERYTQKHVSPSMKEFRIPIDELMVVELPLVRRKYMCGRKNSRSRIDRVFCDPEWLNIFPDIKLCGLNKSISDHCPLHIELTRKEWGKKPFRSLDAWLLHQGFDELIKKEWMLLGDRNLNENLKLLKKPISTWNREVFENINENIQKLEKELHNIDMAIEEQGGDNIIQARREAVVAQLWSWLTKQERYWQQQARMKNLRE